MVLLTLSCNTQDILWYNISISAVPNISQSVPSVIQWYSGRVPAVAQYSQCPMYHINLVAVAQAERALSGTVV